MTKADGPCTFCADGLGETRDHVPPRCFFSSKVPALPALITVPCCRKCHTESQRTDGTVRNVLVSLRDIEPAGIVLGSAAGLCRRWVGCWLVFQGFPPAKNRN